MKFSFYGVKQFPWVAQRDAMQCGVACLAMVCRHFGHPYSLAMLDDLCAPQVRGVSLLGLSESAQALKLETMCVRTSVDKLIAARQFPAILHWNQNHFVVLYDISKSGKKFYISDPGKGKYRLTCEEFEEHWVSTSIDGEGKGIAMLVEPTKDFGSVADSSFSGNLKARDWHFIAGYLKEYKRYFIQIALGLLLGCLLQLALPFLTQGIVDVGISNSDIGIIWLILLGEFMIIAGRTATDFIRRWLVMHISMRINISLVSDFIVKLLALPMRFFDTRHMGDLLQRMNDHQRIQSFLTSQTLNVAFTALSFIIFGIVLLIYDSLIFIVFLGFSAIYAIWIATFLSRRKVLDYELFSASGANSNKTYQLITAMQEIKLQQCEKRRRWEWEDAQADMFEVQMKSLRLQQTQEAGSVFINELKNILITVLAATAVINGHMTLGAMLAVQFIIGQLNSPVEQIMGFIYSLQDVKISLERINEVHDAANEEREHCCVKEFPAKAEHDLKLKDVDFKYDIHSPAKTLEGVTCDIPQGKTTAIVGASGSGKTTLLKLMLGFYPPIAGEIRIAGKMIGEYSPKWWRDRCGVVMQDGVIFSDTIERNIAVGDGEVDRDRLKEAAKIACVDEYIDRLPLKYDTIIGRDGNGLSKGQHQRILIARAVYKNPEFIFLDEATNSLDAANERRIVENLREFYQGKTVIIVAHRLSTVCDADNIIVLNGGRIAEQGTHEQLTSRAGIYYNLIKNQLELGE